MSDLIPTSPLMQPIQYQGQEYFTSQYFHAQYLAHSLHKGKHQRYDSFVRLLKSIEAFTLYVEKGDVVFLTWDEARRLTTKSVSVQGNNNLGEVFRASGYHPLILMNATTQAALAHHLDDELSKQLSVAANTATARQMTRQSAPHLPTTRAKQELLDWLDMAKLLDVPLHIAQQEAVKQVAVSTGVDLRPLMLSAPAQDNINPDDRMLEPTDLAVELGVKSGMEMNRILAALGLQERDDGGGWLPSHTGSAISTLHAWTTDNKTGYNRKWKVSAVRKLLAVRMSS